MLPKIVVAISAYNAPECLAEQIDNVRFFVNPAEVVVYDCSPTGALTGLIDAPICPRSATTRWGHLVPFYSDVMRWVTAQGIDYDYLVAIHSDTLMIRPGLGTYLDEVMASSEYAAPGYLRTNEWCEARLPCLRWFHYGWPRIWGPLYGGGLSGPSWSAGPVQIFRNTYVQKALAFPTFDQLVKLGTRSKNTGIEEMLYSTLADAMDCNPIRLPEENGCRQPIVDLARLRFYLELPTVHIIHKVSLERDDPVRLAVAELQRSGRSQLLAFPTTNFGPWPLDAPVPPTTMRERLKEIYFRFLP